MKVYISGAIKNDPDNYMEKFARVQKHLEDQGIEVVNPTTLPHKHDKKYTSYMKEDTIELLKCDAIFMIWGWQEAGGAKFEHDVAKMCGIETMYGAHI